MTAVAIGTFDGVHLGHRRVIETALATGLPVRVITFDPHPRTVVQGNLVELVTRVERRVELIRDLGVGEVAVIPFTLATAGQEAEAFADEHLADADVVVAGEDFRFGSRRRGDLQLLEALGLEVAAVPLLEGVSSSEIRRLVH
ncbi:MAG: FAD synthetase family protein, partial [Actinobacteria bacterium]|nr:FAD synthetase family protein [Actinomycetota bacterium]